MCFRPGDATKRISPSNRAISRLIASPNPVPPKLRLVLPSACWNTSKMICCLSGGIPMAVSVTKNSSTEAARLRLSFCPPAESGRLHRERDVTLLRELERVR